MEHKIKEELKNADLKTEYLRKSFDQANAQASSILLFTLKWRDLEDHFQKTRNSVEKRAQEVSLRERQLGETAESLEQRLREVEGKERELGDVQKKVDELCADQEKRENQLESIRCSIQECTEEISSKGKQLSEVRSSLDDYNEKLCSKKKQLSTVLKSIEDHNEELHLKEKQLQAVLRSIDGSNREFCSKEKQLNSVCKSIEDRTEELCLKEKQLNAVCKSIEDCNRELDLREKKLDSLCKSIEDCNGELDSREKQLSTLCKSIEIRNGELCSKEMQFSAARKSIEDSDRELGLKKEQLGFLQDEIEECDNELNLKKEELMSVEQSAKKCLGELQLKERELDSVKRILEERCRELSAKDEELCSNREQLGLCQNDLEECRRQLNLKKEELKSAVKSAKKCLGERQLKDRELGSVKRTLEERCRELSAKDEELRLNRELLSLGQNDFEECHRQLNLKKEELKSLEESAKECSEELQLKEIELGLVKRNLEEQCGVLSAKDEELCLSKKQLGLCQNDLAECHEQLNLKEEELNSLETSLKECTGELQLKKRQLGSVKRTLAECCGKLSAKDEELRLKKKQLGFCQNELEIWHKQLNLEKEELKSVEKQLNMLQESIRDSRAELHSLKNELAGVNKLNQECTQGLELGKNQIDQNLTGHGRNLKLLLAKHLKDQDSVYAEVIAKFSASPDPAKLVLDELHSISWKDNMEFDSAIMRRTSILLLERLMKLSPYIKPQVREDAMKLAKEWKAELREPPDNSAQVMCFMLLLAAFKLASAFNVNEQHHLLNFLGQQRQVPELRRAIEKANELQWGEILPCQVEQNEHLKVNNKTDTSFANVQFCTSKETRDLQMVLNEHDVSQAKVLAAVQISPDPAKMVLDTMQESLYQLWKKEDIGFQASFGRNYIVLLEQAMRVSQKMHSQPQVKAAAKKLAMEWKEKLKANTDNSFEVLGFLQFLATYELMSSFKRDEISRLIDIVTPHRRAPEVSRVLGFTDKIPGLIQDLISRKQHLDAVRFSCEFNLTGMFPPARLLKHYWEITGRALRSIPKEGKPSREAQKEAEERERETLKALIRCVTDYKLEKEFPTGEIKKRLDDLEQRKTGGRLSVTAPLTPTQLSLQDQPSSMNASVPRDQLQRITSKRPRTDEPITTPYALGARVPNQK